MNIFENETCLDILKSCVNAKAKSPVVLDVSQVFDLADTFILVSGRSDRHVQGICNSILSCLEEKSIKPYSVEGFDQGHWVLLDFNNIIVHVFHEEDRELYDLESLWIKAKQYRLDEETLEQVELKAA